MIHKIERLISIGKFRNYQATGDVALKKIGLVYGDNGGGKTTLTAILRSLTQNKPELIIRRKSTNQTTNQAAQIIQRSATGDINHNFNPATGWTSPFLGLEIFDIHFVNENIYSGFEFNDEHKKHLHQFVIGAQGIAIQQQIDQNKTDKTSSRQKQGTIELQLIQQVGNNLSIENINQLLAIQKTHSTNIDSNIIAAEAALANANANSIIQTLLPLVQLNRITSEIEFITLLTDLNTTSQTIQNTALKTLFTEHCKELSDNSIKGPESWLREGFAYLESKQENSTGEISVILSCPFCKQSIDFTSDIIKAYTSLFNEEFNSFVMRVQNHLDSIQTFNLEAAIQELKNRNQTNIGRIASWATHLPATVHPPTFNIFTDETQLKADFKSLITIVQQKLQNPTIAVVTRIVTDFQNSLKTINTNIDDYNSILAIYNTGITTFRNSIQSIANAQAEVDRLNRIKKRFEPPIIALCTQLVTERQTLRSLEAAYSQLIIQQETATRTFFSNYRDRINHYLETVFRTLFKIDDVINIPPQGRATQSKIGYKLTIDGQDISFEADEPNCAKDCLSEGDKSTIALAFFLSKLDIDPGLTDKIVIFDDPLSSFDSNRRMYTVQLIKDLFPRIKQLIILSHNEFFLFELSKVFSPGDKKTLRITENFLAKASIIEPLDLESLVENDYFKHIKELENFLAHPDLTKKETVLGWLRNVLEAHIRFKFYRQMNVLPPNQRTLGRLITQLINQGITFRDNTNRTTILDKLNLINGISCRPNHGDPIPDYSTLGVNPTTMNVPELANFINDTFYLIDSGL